MNPDAAVRAHVVEVDTLLTAELDRLRDDWHSVDAAAPRPTDPPEQLRRLVGRGGKRTRPVMALLGWLAAGGPASGRGRDEVVRASAALELLHAFALIHDDVMDESDSRRGHPTVHRDAAAWHREYGGRGDSDRFGESVALLVGDLAHAEADRLAGDLPPGMRRVWRRLVLELVTGQYRDVVGAATGGTDIDAARHVARAKTGYYTVARPLQLGAVAAGAGEPALRALETYGANVGEAFGLRDDLLGVFGDPAETGKPAGDDLRAGKPTVLHALARQRLSGAAAESLAAAGTTRMTDARVRTVSDAMTRDGVVAEVEQMISDRIADAVAAVTDAARSGVLTDDGVDQLIRTAHDLGRRSR